MAWRWDGYGASHNESNNTCSGIPSRPSCYLEPSELGKWDAVAAVRMVISCLSILGALSIIVSAIAKRQVWSAKVHPIFVLSVADLLLALLWVIGGTIWLRRGVDRAWCFAVSLPTIILMCVTVNLTLVYACLAYSNLKRTDFGNILLNLDKTTSKRVWPATKTVAVYCVAWLLPVVLVMSVFGVIAGRTTIVTEAQRCSCWCRPVFGNILPYAIKRDSATAQYVHNIRILIASYGVLVGAHYLVVFFLLLVVYYKILKYIKKMQLTIGQSQNYNNYGATQALLSKGKSKARKRVVYFLTVFIASGFFNLLLSIFTIVYESVQLHREHEDGDNGPLIEKLSNSPVYQFYLCLFILQGVTIPVQGFLNAIVYGWTRDDFLYVMSMRQLTTDQSEEVEVEVSAQEIEEESAKLDDSGIHISTNREYSFTRTIVVHTDNDDD